jgi:hypothetical protein
MSELGFVRLEDERIIERNSELGNFDANPEKW